MTAQAAERLRYEGRGYPMFTNPLGSYFAMGGAKPAFMSTSTALWRGYVGTWEIVNGRLYLIGLEGTLKGGGDASLATVFPGFPRRVFAHWYSGTLRIPQGGMLEYIHIGYGSTYERDLLLEVERGVVTHTTVRQNPPVSHEKAPARENAGAKTAFAQRNRDRGGAS